MIAQPITLIIPAAGDGSRFKEIGIKTPKPLIQILKLPMLCWVIGNFQLNQDDTLIIIVRDEHKIEEGLENYLSNLKCKIIFHKIESLSAGPASTISYVLDRVPVNTPVIVANSDQFVSPNCFDLTSKVRESIDPGIVFCMKANGSRWSFANIDSYGYVSEIREKIEISEFATIGIYAWRNVNLMINSFAKMFEVDDKTNGEYYVAPSYNYMISEGMGVKGEVNGILGQDVFGLGTPEDLAIFLRAPGLNLYKNFVLHNLSLSNVAL